MKTTRYGWPKPFLLISLVLALLIGACTTESADPEPDSPGNNAPQLEEAEDGPTTEPTTYRLGVAVPLTGTYADGGTEFLRFTEMGVAKANEVYADEGITIELVVEDSLATAEGGVAAMTRLGAVHETPMVVAAISGVVFAGAPVAEDLGMVMVNTGGASANLVGLSSHLVNFFPMADQSVPDFAHYIVEELGFTRVAVINTDNESGQGSADVMVAEIESLGGEIVARETIRQDATDATTQVAKVQAANPDFVFIQTLPIEGAAVLKAAREQNLTMQLGSYVSIGQDRIVREAGQEYMNGLLYMSPTPADDDAVHAIMDEYISMYPNSPLAQQSYDSYFYATPFLFAEAIKHLRSLGLPVTGDNILSTLREVSDFEVPVVGAVDLTSNLTYRAPTVIRRVTDHAADPLNDEVAAQVAPR